MRVSQELLDWSIQRLVEWANDEKPNRRFKQTLYRLFMLSQLGVTADEELELLSTAFSNHCRTYLLVSTDADASKTGGRSSYFVPFTAEYQCAVSGSDWAVGTMWTRLSTRDVDEYLEWSKDDQKRTSFKFKASYGEYFKKKLKSNPIPALALAAFLLRNRDIEVPESAGDDSKQERHLIEAFLEEFRFKGLSWVDEAFDLSGTSK